MGLNSEPTGCSSAAPVVWTIFSSLFPQYQGNFFFYPSDTRDETRP